MQKRFWLSVFLFAFMLSTAYGNKTALAQSPQPMADKMNTDHPTMTAQVPAAASSGLLKITNGTQSVEWTPTTLAALPHVTITVYNEHAKAKQTYSGVPLDELLTRLGEAEKPHGGKDFRQYLVVEGADGYGVVYSIGEVNPTVHDATVIVADTVDGKPLAEAGPFQLVATGEKRPARWVRNLVSVRVLTAQ